MKITEIYGITHYSGMHSAHHTSSPPVSGTKYKAEITLQPQKKKNHISYSATVWNVINTVENEYNIVHCTVQNFWGRN